MLRKTLGLLLCFALIFCLCGCDFFAADTAELLSPPEPVGDIKPISEVIKETSSANLVMKYPSRGNYRSAVIREDIDSDGTLEAFAFYSVTDRDIITMNINAICMRDGEWTSVATQQIVAAGVDKIEFCDLDADGIKEILVGWQIYGTSEMQLAVYSLGENSLTQRMLKKYSQFISCDLDADGKNEILVLKTGFAESANMASIFELDESGVIESSTCELDHTVKTVSEPIIDVLSNGKPAVYIDILKGVGTVTEVLFMEKEKLVNPLYNAETGETSATLRSVSLGIKDINEDGIIEIPVQEEVPSVTHLDINEKLYLTNWCSFNGEILTNQMTTMINVNDGYYLNVSAKLIGKIAVLKDTENRVREIYYYNVKKGTVGKSLIYLKAVEKSDLDKGEYKSLGATEILNYGTTSVICKVSSDAEKLGIDLEYVRSNLKIFEGV